MLDDVVNQETSSLSSLNPTNEEVEELKNEIDEDGDGEIDFDEFLEIMNSTKLRYNYRNSE